jgi:hypothetical protein
VSSGRSAPLLGPLPPLLERSVVTVGLTISWACAVALIILLLG